MTILKRLLISATIALIEVANAHAGSLDLPSPQLCSTPADCTKLIDSINEPTKLAQALADRCGFQFKQSSLQMSTRDCDRAIALDPLLVPAYDIRSRINDIISGTSPNPGEKQKAAARLRADLDKIVELAPKQASSYLLRGHHLVEIEQYQLALEDLNRAAAISPNDPLVYLFRSSAYKGTGKDDLALKDCEKFLAIAPPRSDILTMMAEIHLARHELEQAMVLAGRAVELSSDEGRADNANLSVALTQRGRIYLATGDKGKARQDFTSGIAAYPDGSEAREALGALLNKKIPSEFDCTFAAISVDQNSELHAIEVCNDLLEVTDSRTAREQRAKLYLGTRQYDLAVADFSKLLAVDPNNLGYYRSRAEAFHGAGRQDLALADLNKVIRPPHTTFAYLPLQQIENSQRTDLVFRAEIEIAAGQHAEALRDVSEVLANAPENPYALTIRAWLKTRQGNLIEAKQDLDLVVAKNGFIFRELLTKVRDALTRESQADAEAAFGELFQDI
ncbi:tetratricopeptide repeat protein [Rhizobium sp. 2YAF20]|uniref:tetratricopeptide repeat protein n=1 Tax=Rhizobium sp. 2YAF20 TaxID=3233027 RepID=UPI003F95DD0A